MPLKIDHSKNVIQILVYGTLRRGQYNHSIIEEGDYVATVEIPGFEMITLGPFPAVRPGEGSIVGEVYRVNPSTLKRVDVLEGFPLFYDRLEVDTPVGVSWMYYIKQVDGAKIDSGDWVAHKEAK